MKAGNILNVVRAENTCRVTDEVITDFIVGLVDQFRHFHRRHERTQLYPIGYIDSPTGPWVRGSFIAIRAGLPGSTWICSRAFAQLVDKAQPLIQSWREVSARDIRVTRGRHSAQLTIEFPKWLRQTPTIHIQVYCKPDGSYWAFLPQDTPNVMPWLEFEE